QGMLHVGGIVTGQCADPGDDDRQQNDYQRTGQTCKDERAALRLPDPGTAQFSDERRIRRHGQLPTRKTNGILTAERKKPRKIRGFRQSGCSAEHPFLRVTAVTTLTYASSPQSRRRELVVGRRGAAELRCRGFLCIHAQGDVATCQQVIQGFHGVARNLVLVVEGQVPFTYTPQGTTTVIVVSQGDHPGVFIHKEVTLGVDVALTLLHVTLYFPGTVQFEAGVLGIDVTGLEHISVLQTRLGQLAGVVRQKDLFLADQFPVIAVRSATVHGEVVSGTHAVGSGTRTVIGDLRGATYTTLTGVVYPG